MLFELGLVGTDLGYPARWPRKDSFGIQYAWRYIDVYSEWIIVYNQFQVKIVVIL